MQERPNSCSTLVRLATLYTSVHMSTGAGVHYEQLCRTFCAALPVIWQEQTRAARQSAEEVKQDAAAIAVRVARYVCSEIY